MLTIGALPDCSVDIPFLEAVAGHTSLPGGATVRPAPARLKCSR